MIPDDHDVYDIDSSSKAAVTSGTSVGRAAVSDSVGQTAIPILQEELVVSKREVDRGGVRVHSHLVEVPVHTDVTLRDEHINVQRRAVDRPATAADFFEGSMIELNAIGEEAVVGKSSRIVEEVLVGKSLSEHTHTLHDTVRRTEVEVEELPAAKSARRTY